MSFYAGIGSRETPEDILAFMTELATWLARQGWRFRSGGCYKGPDTAMEMGHDLCPTELRKEKEIFLPWAGYPKEQPNPSPLNQVSQAAINMSMALHL